MSMQREYWEHIEGKTILAIDATPMFPNDVDRAVFETVSFYVEGFCLRLTTDADTDEIALNIEACALPDSIVQTAKALKALKGREFFWLWLAENSQGYMDAVMMSFADLEITEANSLAPAVPQVAFVGASGIQMLLLSEAV